ncbi:conserved hypothetical protein [Vibrio rotiferianus]|nr:hypothetical protein VCHENC03_1595 [Vibrio sp. HENC-03]CAH1529135.1 conserved hypothetical protein [Vibrio rotiferianus]CAH1604113.1 conserved hypothetical protein [Vibrio jasicida]
MFSLLKAYRNPTSLQGNWVRNAWRDERQSVTLNEQMFKQKRCAHYLY